MVTEPNVMFTPTFKYFCEKEEKVGRGNKFSMEAKGCFAVFLALVSITGAFSTTFTVKNNCPYTVWPGTLTGGGGSQLSKTGFELAPGASSSVDAPAGWSGRFFARTGCSTDSGRLTCATADCASGAVECNGAGAIPPATLLEFKLNGDGGKDFYDVSLVDGYNLPASITPKGGCSSTECRSNINSICPPQLSVKDGGGSVVACKSACEALREPQYCCTGSFNTPQTCPPTDYSKIFKDACPQAYSYAYDDASSTFTCAAGGNYDITFCP
ncbi:thaumatin-like protein 1b [Papaver somniferum]|uniref:thaumatin-like protein 1b n=1 Tax=Papaver somniferum TaxID=3469 RepID=UPI000E6FECA4|nr:thaumatin-like protein 1b [Papaver somniferum]